MQRKPYHYMCGTPVHHCTGGIAKLNHGLEGRGLKSHANHEDAFNCQRRYLLSQGYTQTGGRSFAAPSDGPILILTKKIRYGGKLRNGKEGTRNMPHKRGAGIIVG